MNSSFDFNSPTKVSGTYHETPYPLLRVKLADNTFKNIVLIGAGKYGANPYLKALKEEEGDLSGKQLVISGNLVYYNGKTLLEITDSEQISLKNSARASIDPEESLGNFELEGEVVDPKCYFGVMKPGYGKIHRSCATLCISGGIPPVFVATNPDAVAEYFLLTDINGNPINKDILPFVGKPSRIKGEAFKSGDWYTLKIDIDSVETLKKEICDLLVYSEKIL